VEGSGSSQVLREQVDDVHAPQWKVHVSYDEARTGTHRSDAGQSLTGFTAPADRYRGGREEKRPVLDAEVVIRILNRTA
jgi:hypothetical protein